MEEPSDQKNFKNWKQSTKTIQPLKSIQKKNRVGWPLPLGHPLTIQRCIRKLKNDSHRPVPQNQILSNCPHLSRLTVHPFLSVSTYWFHFFHYFLSVHCCTLACVVLNLALHFLSYTQCTPVPCACLQLCALFAELQAVRAEVIALIDSHPTGQQCLHSVNHVHMRTWSVNDMECVRQAHIAHAKTRTRKMYQLHPTHKASGNIEITLLLE